MSLYILPVLLICVLVYSCIKRVRVYDCFVEGTRDALKLCLSIFPYIGAIFVCIQLFKESGVGAYVAKWLSYPMSLLGIPAELSELILLIPFSGGGSLALLEDAIAKYGADSFITRCACTIMGSSETIFYIATVYFSGVKQKKLRYAIPVSLLASLGGAVIACLLCRFM